MVKLEQLVVCPNPNRKPDVTAGRIHGQISIPFPSPILFPISHPLPYNTSRFHSNSPTLSLSLSTRTRPMERPTRPYAPGGREDCWSDDATSVLITAWGDRYLRLNRGNLRQKDWKEVADSVNSRRDGAVFKTDGQCKNRIDTLKKKYKLEKSKPFPSTWIFYDSLDSLIGVPSSNAAALTRPPKPLTLALTLKSAADPSPLGFRRCGSTESDGEDDVEGGGVGLAGGAACRELARAILKFGEIYERMESSKQEQMVELEKQRMAFTKELEVQRLNMFMDAQLELEKMKKRPKYSKHSSGKKL
ncbi:trihelix transcription factor ASIL2 [Rosa chinensis]|nr:trihelix transcription factor ASIL2 [Rosa chinensis]